MILYHGSKEVVKTPVFHGGKRTNDYGYGFYYTENLELAKEWACIGNTDGIVNVYNFFDAQNENLKIIDLNSKKYNILNWLALLTKNRTYWQKSSIAETAKVYLQNEFFPKETLIADIIIGYRADDSFFSFAQDFVANIISLRQLKEALVNGQLGNQIVLVSKKVYDEKYIKFKDSFSVKAIDYFSKKETRDYNARKIYKNIKNNIDFERDIFMLDILREEMKNNDPRLYI